MKKEWLLTIGVAFLTLFVAMGVIRWFAPQLLGIRADMQVVRVSERVVPFFESVFRKEDYANTDFLIKDPYTRVRAKPLYGDKQVVGPHDILGFRNRFVPNDADIVAIGDSQTYGNNSPLEQNWPSQMVKRLCKKRATVYSMAVGGWGAVQYLDMAGYATAFQPRVIVVAFYTGNDPLESFLMAYSVERWFPLRPDRSLGLSDTPPTTGFPPPDSERWSVRLRNGRTMVFTPKLRLASNHASNRAVRAGYEIMASSARQIAHVAQSVNARAVFTIIPTKELVYAERLKQEQVKLNSEYSTLIHDERSNIEKLAKELELTGGTYVDLVGPLQRAALNVSDLYPHNMDGHPLPNGYRVIAQTLASAVSAELPQAPNGLVARSSRSDTVTPYLIRDEKYWAFATQEILEANGWAKTSIPLVSSRDLNKLAFQGTIRTVDRRRFGPNISVDQTKRSRTLDCIDPR